MNKSRTQIEGAGAFFNNKYQIVISSFDKESKPSGWTKTYLNSKHTQANYSFYNQDGTVKLYHRGLPLQHHVENLHLTDDKNGFNNTKRTALIFTGLLVKNKPFIGILKYQDKYDDDYIEEGQFTLDKT